MSFRIAIQSDRETADVLAAPIVNEAESNCYDIRDDEVNKRHNQQKPARGVVDSDEFQADRDPK